MFYILSLKKILFLNRTFYEILMSMKEDLNNNYSVTENKRIITDKSTLSSRISNFLISYFAITFFLYSGVALVVFDEDQGKFLVRMEFPFIATISPRYEIILIIQFIFESFIVYGAATSIALIAALVSNFFNHVFQRNY